MPTVARSTSSRPEHSSADCHASREPFDAAFRCINERRDIGSDAKLVHARLVTNHRLGRDETQTEIGQALGLSRHQVWRAIGDLVAAGLIQVIRYGLGRPNGYVILGVDRETLDGTSGRASASRPVRAPQAGQSGTPARGFLSSKKNGKNDQSTVPEKDYLQTRDHGSTDYLATRYGPLRPRP